MGGRIGLDALVEGEYYEGEFQDDLPNGWGVYNYENGSVVEGMFEHGVPYVEDDAAICGEGGLFNPHAMIYALTETPDLDEMGLEVPQCCIEIYAGMMDIWGHFLEIADDFGDDQIVTSQHPRRVVPHPSVDDLAAVGSRGSSAVNTPDQLQQLNTGVPQ